MWKKLNQSNIKELLDGEPILIKRNSRSYWEVACYNIEYKCFDDSEGDDYLCDIEDVELYMIVPDFEN